jgi:hypothetical protein
MEGERISAESVDNLKNGKRFCLVPPTPTNPQIERSNEPSADLVDCAKSTSRFLRTFGFHVLAVLLGIALAFM